MRKLNIRHFSDTSQPDKIIYRMNRETGTKICALYRPINGIAKLCAYYSAIVIVRFRLTLLEDDGIMRCQLICAGVGSGARLKAYLAVTRDRFLLGLKYADYRIMWLATTCSRGGVTAAGP